MRRRIVTLLHCYIAKKTLLFWFVILFLFTLPSSLYTAHAQNIATQKKVVSTYSMDNPDQLFPFPGSDCPEKDKGDANCDGNVNFFDLSIWQVETNNPAGSKRADFNNDGFVNMTDYGIWRGTFYGEQLSSVDCHAFQTNEIHPVSIVTLLNCYIVETQTNLSRQFSNLAIKQLLPTVFAQTQNPGTGNIHRSLPFISANDTSLILNQNSDGTTSEIRLDENSNPFSSLVLDANGNVTARANFTDNGDEWIATGQDGISIQTLKKAEGPIFQYFKGGDALTLAIKSWPTLASFESGDPPVAVTLPVNDKWLTLSVNPNGTSIVAQTDKDGGVLKQTQYRNDGSYISQDNRYQTFTEANEKIGLLAINMPNSLGGRTTYNFYKSGLYAIVQTDKNNDYYIAKPVDKSGDSWTLESSLNHNLKTVTDPIGEVGSNTPGPDEIIAGINYYRSIPNQNSISFSDGFGTNSKIFPEQIAKANQILNIDSAELPQTTSWNIGIRDTFAAKSDDSNSAASSAGSAAPATTSNATTGIGNNTATVTVNPDGTQTSTISGVNGQQLASTTTSANANTTFSAGGTDVAVNSGYVARFVPATPGGGTPTSFPTSGGPTTCFLAGTKISTPNGRIDIEKLKPGMKVYSFNEKTGQKEVADFAGLDINFVDEYLIINNRIHTTTYHPFYIVIPHLMRDPEKATWIPGQARNDRNIGMINKTSALLSLIKAGRLKVGDLLVDESGSWVPITSIQKITKKETVYNLLTVTPNNNFYAEGILVHNYQENSYRDGRVNNNTEQNNNQIDFGDNFGEIGLSSTDGEVSQEQIDTNDQAQQGDGRFSGTDQTVGNSDGGDGNGGNTPQ